MEKKLISLSLVVSLAALSGSGCQTRLGSNQYTAASVKQASQVYSGVIISVRQVEISETDNVGKNTTGAGIGALTGGLLGLGVGKGRGNVAAVGAGALLGGVAGAYAQDALGRQSGFEYTVKLGNGEILQVVQTDPAALPVGQRVFVSLNDGPEGRPRVTPDNTGLPMDTRPLAKKSSPMVVINNNR